MKGITEDVDVIPVSVGALQKRIATLEAQLAEAQEQIERLRKLGNDPSSIPCCDCGGPVVEFSIPNDAWNTLIRHDAPETGEEYLCLSCFALRAAEWVREIRATSDSLCDALIAENENSDALLTSGTPCIGMLRATQAQLAEAERKLELYRADQVFANNTIVLQAERITAETARADKWRDVVAGMACEDVAEPGWVKNGDCGECSTCLARAERDGKVKA